MTSFGVSGRCRVIVARQTSYPDPISLKKGEEVRIEERESEWSGWLWCTTAGGRSGWAPEAFILRQGQHGVMNRDYDATELNVEPGEFLTVLEEQSGWLNCRNLQGQIGWVPIENVELIV